MAIWSLNSSGRLTNPNLPYNISGGPIIDTDVPPMYGYPATFWHYDEDENRLVLDNICYNYTTEPIVDEPTGRDDLTMFMSPYPSSFWSMGSNNKLTLGILPTPIISPKFVQPFPASFWWYDGTFEVNRLRDTLIPSALPYGACIDCTNMEELKLPRTVKKIGRNTFTNTSLKEEVMEFVKQTDRENAYNIMLLAGPEGYVGTYVEYIALLDELETK